MTSNEPLDELVTNKEPPMDLSEKRRQRLLTDNFLLCHVDYWSTVPPGSRGIFLPNEHIISLRKEFDENFGMYKNFLIGQNMEKGTNIYLFHPGILTATDPVVDQHSDVYLPVFTLSATDGKQLSNLAKLLVLPYDPSQLYQGQL